MGCETNIYVGVIDNDESLCRSLHRLLRTVGFQVVTYASAESFLSDDKRPRFDCLILDVQLNGMSGMELRSHLQSVGSPAPIIFVTAQEDSGFRTEALAAGCAGYFSKTDAGETIIKAIRQAVAAAETL